MKINELDSEESVKISAKNAAAIAGMHRWLLMLIEEAKKGEK